MSDSLPQENISAPAQTGENNRQYVININGGLPKNAADVLDAFNRPSRSADEYAGWSTELPKRPAVFTAFPDAGMKLQALKRDGILAVECADPFFLHEAAAWISEVGGYESQLLVTQNNEALSENIQRPNLKGYIGWLQAMRRNKPPLTPGGLLVVFHVEGVMLSTALAEAQNSLAAYKGALPSDGIHLVFLIFPESATTVGGGKLKSAAEVWNLPILPLLLRRVTRGSADQQEPRLAALQARIEVQRTERRWSASEAAFLRELQGALGETDSLVALEAEVERRAQAAITSLLKPVQERSELARTGTVVERALLFTAAFCARCSVHEQTLLLEAILATKEYPPPLARTLPVRRPRQDSVEGSGSEPSSKLAIDYWRNESLTVMERCGVHVVTGSDGARFVEFQNDNMAEAVRNGLSDAFVIECFESVSRGMIFHLDASQTLVDKLVRLAAEMCERYPDRFGESWLRSVLGSIGHLCALSLQSDITPQISLGEWFGELARALEENGRLYNRLHYRLSALCNGMMERPMPKMVVMKFVETLINEKACGVAIKLAKRLCNREPDAAYRWLKRCLNEGPEDDREFAEKALFELAQVGASEFDVMLRAVDTWRPDADREVVNFSHSEYFATLLPLQIYGRIKIGDADLAQMDGKESSAARWQRLMAWICLPKLDEVLIDGISDSVEGLHEFADRTRAFCIASWALRAGPTSCLVVIDALRKVGSMRQQRVARDVIGSMLAEADKRWLKAVDSAYRSPHDPSQKRRSTQAKQHREVLKQCWQRLSEKVESIATA